MRDGGYQQSTWATTAGFTTLSSAQTQWHAQLSSWCTNGGPPGPGGSLGSALQAIPQASVCAEVERRFELPPAGAPSRD
jgi:hypothetical protein